MSDETPKGGGGMRAVVLWLVIALLLAAVWWLASERNERHYHAAAQGQQLVIERGRFFPTGTVALPESDKLYGPVAIPKDEKAPAEMEFDDQNALDRWLFDVLSGWARDAAKKNDTKTAATLTDRAASLPGLTGAQVGELTALQADLAWDQAQIDEDQAAALLDDAARKLNLVQSKNGAHAVEAGQKIPQLQEAAKNLRQKH
jgi:hypothetical protein